ncbi:hypothetical protein THTE_1183 [Thermogutta terrifontis]|uniref:Uncharacterized protein n=1 Tax=Thermogutta terrifontis TaxID=1331910 RepID=A0A286RCU4_9BACT|nr:hypothetical protein THTE_1183 [Thermogutta terrifontis]
MNTPPGLYAMPCQRNSKLFAGRQVSAICEFTPSLQILPVSGSAMSQVAPMIVTLRGEPPSQTHRHFSSANRNANTTRACVGAEFGSKEPPCQGQFPTFG